MKSDPTYVVSISKRTGPSLIIERTQLDPGLVLMRVIQRPDNTDSETLRNFRKYLRSASQPSSR